MMPNTPSHERQSLCVRACEGIPNTYLDRGADGLWAWFQRHPQHGITPNYDTWLTLDDLRRHLPQERSVKAIYLWASLGVSNRKGRVVKLHTELRNGVKCTTLRHLAEMNLRCDPNSLEALTRPAAGPKLYLALCGHCERPREFEADPKSEDPRRALEALGWSKNGDGWRCEECQ